MTFKLVPDADLPLCPKCGRPRMGWPIKRPNTCSVKRAALCIRNLEENNG